MNGQLRLLDAAEHDWRLDERTRTTGRKGLAAARKALQEASRRAASRSAA